MNIFKGLNYDFSGSCLPNVVRRFPDSGAAPGMDFYNGQKRRIFVTNVHYVIGCHTQKKAPGNREGGESGAFAWQEIL